MNDKFKKLIDKKKAMGKTLSPVESAAKGSVLEDLKGMAGQAMSDKLNGLKKVSVASDTEEGLKHGLEKAHEIVSGKQQHEMRDDTEGGKQDLDDEQGATPDHTATNKEKEHADFESGQQDDMEEGSPEEEASESEEEASAEGDEPKKPEHMSHDELDEHIKHLLELKKSKKSIHNPY